MWGFTTSPPDFAGNMFSGRHKRGSDDRPSPEDPSLGMAVWDGRPRLFFGYRATSMNIGPVGVSPAARVL